VVEGSPSAEIAHILALSPKTVDTYQSRIKQKLGIHDLRALVKFATQHDLTSLEWRP
jgi:DNA-binding NarL/FixJ family response regulator